MATFQNRSKKAVIFLLTLCLCLTFVFQTTGIAANGDRAASDPPFTLTAVTTGDTVTVSLKTSASFVCANIGGTVVIPSGFVCSAIDGGTDLESSGLNLFSNADSGIFIIDGPNDGSSRAWENGSVSITITVDNGETPPPEQPDEYEITVIQPQNGKVAVDPSAVAAGANVVITVTPDNGYKVDTVTVTDGNGRKVSVTGGGSLYSFKMPDSPVSVSVTFVKINGGDHESICPSKDFIDVDTGAWYHEAVDYALSNGLMNGVGDGRFDPAGTTTRAMIVTILYRLEGEPSVETENPFVDVLNGIWYTDPIIWAAENGIVNGYGDGVFAPMDNITREQLATMLYRYAEYKGYNVKKSADLSVFADARDVSSWALAAMRWANAEGLINGKTPTALAPRDNAKRAEAAAILMRFIENV